MRLHRAELVAADDAQPLHAVRRAARHQALQRRLVVRAARDDERAVAQKAKLRGEKPPPPPRARAYERASATPAVLC